MIHLAVEELLHIAERTLGGDPMVRDLGLLESALARPRASAFGQDAYPTLEGKAAALVHSLVRNRALVDGNKRLGLMGLIVFLGVNGRRPIWTNDEAYDLIVEIADGRLDDVQAIAERIRAGTLVAQLVPVPPRAAPSRLGFLSGAISIPGDFDSMAAETIASDFRGE